jgi:hypothetical protein
VTFTKVLKVYLSEIYSLHLIFHFHTWVLNISTTFTLLHPFFISSPFYCYQYPGAICFTFLFSVFQNKTFLLRYLQSFIMTFPCICVLYLELILPLHFSPFYLTSLMVISTGLKVLYSFVCRKYINHIHIFYFLLAYSSPLHTNEKSNSHLHANYVTTILFIRNIILISDSFFCMLRIVFLCIIHT